MRILVTGGTTFVSKYIAEYFVNSGYEVYVLNRNTRPQDHVLNVGNEEMISVKDWVTICYESLGKSPSFVNVYDDIEQRNYFSFYDYEYCLDVSLQQKMIKGTIPLAEGLKESAEWYLKNESDVKKKPFIEYIDLNLLRD